MEITTKEDLVNIIKGLTTDMASMQEELTTLKAPTKEEESTKKEDEPPKEEEKEDVVEDVDEIHQLLSSD